MWILMSAFGMAEAPERMAEYLPLALFLRKSILKLFRELFPNNKG
jgi:hypothetical protein